ncbi:hypothetical protein LXL04_023921 [Taraxacum kok-saghyz]
MPTLEDSPYMTINHEVEIFTNKELTRMMEMRRNIRSISVIGDVASGTSTLIDSLVVAAGVIHQEAGYFMDTRVDEIEQIMSIKSTSISRSYKMTNEALKALTVEHNGNEYLINLIDSPGHIDLSLEAITALHVTDEALLIVDSMEGVGLQTQSLISQIFRERVVPFLIINKIDDCFFELQVDGEKAYRSFQRVIQNMN